LKKDACKSERLVGVQLSQSQPNHKPKIQIPALQPHRLAANALPPGDRWKSDPWEHSRSQPPGGSLAPSWRHTRKRGPEWFYWYTAWRLWTYRQAVALREVCWAF